MRCSLDILMKRSAMLTVPNEGTSECLTEESPPLAPKLDSGTRANPRPVAGNKPNNTDASGIVRGGLPPRVLRRVREHIDANIEQRISVEALAQLANLSVCDFVRAFKQPVGVTPHNYLIQRRVRPNSELLSETKLPLSEIALAAGFVNAGNTLRRIVENVINDSVAARLESLAASVDSDANVCPKTGSTHRYHSANRPRTAPRKGKWQCIRNLVRDPTCSRQQQSIRSL